MCVCTCVCVWLTINCKFQAQGSSDFSFLSSAAACKGCLYGGPRGRCCEGVDHLSKQSLRSYQCSTLASLGFHLHRKERLPFISFLPQLTRSFLCVIVIVRNIIMDNQSINNIMRQAPIPPPPFRPWFYQCLSLCYCCCCCTNEARPSPGLTFANVKRNLKCISNGRDSKSAGVLTLVVWLSVSMPLVVAVNDFNQCK